MKAGAIAGESVLSESNELQDRTTGFAVADLNALNIEIAEQLTGNAPFSSMNRR